MSKYNQKTVTKTTVTNHQGGTAKALNPKLELISLLFTGLTTKFYEKESDGETRLIKSIKEVAKKDVEFVAKAIIYARSVIGQRSITHAAASIISPMLSGNPLGSRFFSKRLRNVNSGGVVYRMDDMLEIASYHFMKNPGKALPNAIKKGFKDAIEKASDYELAKYQGKGKSLSMIDMFNLVHPKAQSEHQDVIFTALMKGELKQFDTREDKMVASGQKIAKAVKTGELTKTQAVKALKEEKQENWKTLITTDKIGYLALLRNLRNIAQDADEVTFDHAMKSLVNPIAIKKSLVFPHQIDIAFMVIMGELKQSNYKTKTLLTAINNAYNLAIPNLTNLFKTGRTAVVIDVSGSMRGGGSYFKNMSFNGKQTNFSPIDKAALIGATLSKGIGADMYMFATRCDEVRYNPLDTVNTIKQSVINKIGAVGHSTSFNSIFEKLMPTKYDRIFVISDLQGGDTVLSNSAYQDYTHKHGQPYIYSIDLVGYGTTMFKQHQKLINLYGYSSDIYEMIKTAEINPLAIIKEINKIRI